MFIKTKLMPEQILKYTVIKTKTQYKEYVKALEKLDELEEPTNGQEEEIELLTLLIEKWDQDHNTFNDVDPITLIRSLMTERGVRAADIVKNSRVSKSLLSDILNYKKAMSKEIIRILAGYFKVSQEILNRPYALKKHTSQQLSSNRANNQNKLAVRSKASKKNLQLA
jgi:HTH-type transcriptional regulator / antitoxin HigA